MSGPILALNFLNGLPGGGGQAACALLGDQPYQFGDMINVGLPNANASTNYTSGLAYNRLAVFNGELYAHIFNGIYRLDHVGTGQGTWTQVDAVAKSTGVQWDVTGPIYNVLANGVPTLVAFYRATSNRVAVRWSTDGVSWNTAESGASGSTSSFFFKSIVYQDFIFLKHTTGNVVQEFNFVSKTWTQYSSVDFPSGTFSTNHTCGDFFIYGGALYFVNWLNAGTTTSFLGIWEYIAGTWDLVYTTDGLLDTGTSMTTRALTSFVDGDRAYIIGEGQANLTDNSTFCLEVDLTGTDVTATEIGDTVFGADTALRNRPDGLTSTSYSYHHYWVDYFTDPKSPTIYWYYARDKRIDSDTRTRMFGVYRWNGPNAEMDYLYDLDNTWALPSRGQVAIGTGVVLDTFRSIELTDDLTFIDASTVEFSFQVTGLGTGLSLQLLYDVNEEEPQTVATLTGVPTGGGITRNVNTLENVDASDVTVYTARWDIGTDLVSGGDQISLRLVVV